MEDIDKTLKRIRIFAPRIVPEVIYLRFGRLFCR
nr:MAG TPA: hypothetical protein [Caudoviricetes sp.]